MDLSRMGYITPEDYDKITHIDFNRDVDQKHQNKIQAIIEKFGFITVVVIKKIIVEGKEKILVLDGQHRIGAGINLRLDIPYYDVSHIEKEEIPKIIAILNTTSKKWTLKDYFNLYYRMEEKEYVWLDSFLNKTNLSLHYALYLWTANPLYRIIESRDGWKTFRRGEWERDADLQSNVDEILQKFYELKSIVEDKKVALSSQFSDSILKIILHPKYKHDKMVVNLRRNMYDLSDCRSHNDFFDALVAIYNRNKSGRLKFDYQLAIDGVICTSVEEVYTVRGNYVDLDQYHTMLNGMYSFATLQTAKKHQPNMGVADIIKGNKKYWKMKTAEKSLDRELAKRGL